MVEEYLMTEREKKETERVTFRLFRIQLTIKGFRERIDCYANVSLSGTSLLNAGVKPRSSTSGLRSAFFVLLRDANRFTDRQRDTRDCNSCNDKFAAASCLESEAAACNIIKYYATDAN